MKTVQAWAKRAGLFLLSAIRHRSRFQWSDAWIFVAAVNATRESPSPGLQHLLGWADGINRAIPSRDELTGAFTRLVASGFAEQSNETIVPTAAGLELYPGAQGPGGIGAFEETNRVAARLAKLTPPSDPPLIAVSEESLAAALREYSQYVDQVTQSILQKLVPKVPGDA
jgi:hypothetical protein